MSRSALLYPNRSNLSLGNPNLEPKHTSASKTRGRNYVLGREERRQRKHFSGVPILIKINGDGKRGTRWSGRGCNGRYAIRYVEGGESIYDSMWKNRGSNECVGWGGGFRGSFFDNNYLLLSCVSCLSYKEFRFKYCSMYFKLSRKCWIAGSGALFAALHCQHSFGYVVRCSPCVSCFSWREASIQVL